MNRIFLSLLSMAMLAANSIAAPSVAPYILTPPAPASPRINGASVFGSRAVGFFNLGVKPMELSFKDFAKLGLAGRQAPRDLWRQKNLAAVDAAMDSLPLTIPAHDVVLCKFTTVK